MGDAAGAIFLFAAALVVLSLLVVAGRRSSVVIVTDQAELPQDRETVERYAFGPLGAIPGAAMTQSFPGQVTLVSKWTPTWAVFIGILAFPVGLLLLFLVRQDLVLHVRFLDNGTGTSVQVAGKSRRAVAMAVGSAIDQLATAAKR